MIDKEGYRANVGIIICNAQGQVLWARRIGGRDAWQFPQGGLNHNESPEQALYRELKEEVGLNRGDVKILASTRSWLRYRLPSHLVRQNQKPLCIGQKQKWYLLQLISEDGAVDVNSEARPEFDTWQWASYWYPLDQVVAFKRDVYRKALKELSMAHCRLESGDDKAYKNNSRRTSGRRRRRPRRSA